MMSKVVLYKTNHMYYFREGSFRPSKKYPEYIFTEISDSENFVYDAIREAFRMMGLDSEHYGMEEWNPLSEFIESGDTVLIKPNMVMHINTSGEGEECLYTQPSVVAPVVDYVVKALNGRGKIIVADAPMQACDFDKLIKDSGYDKLVDFYKKNINNISIELKDMRGIRSVRQNGLYVYQENSNQKGIVVQLNEDSEFAGLSEKQISAMRITDYDPDILNRHHNADIHEYAISEDVLNADVIINMPKCKMHRKAGITAALKNCVGACTRKEYLPHHTNGALLDENNGGDAYKSKSLFRDAENFLLDWRNRLLQTQHRRKAAWLLNQLCRIDRVLARHFGNEKYSEGSWYGNNTISKTITDLNKIIFYADNKGNLRDKKVRKYLIVADMIIVGDKEGPLAPSAVPIGLIGVGDNPVTFDEVIATLYGARMEYMHAINQARGTYDGKYPLVDENDVAEIVSNESKWDGKRWHEILSDEKLPVTPCSSWKEAFY